MTTPTRLLVFASLATACCLAYGDDSAQLPSPLAPSAPGGSTTLVSQEYVLRPGDMVQVKVYQEEDLGATSRIGSDGTLTVPLLGSIKVVSNTVGQATMTISNMLARDYLVNPQVTVNVTEFAKRRFTVLGQVQRPGTYEMPAEEAVNLLQAIATAGGFTRIGNARKITVQRTVGQDNLKIRLDSEAMSKK